jgi:hypothetical protein
VNGKGRTSSKACVLWCNCRSAPGVNGQIFPSLDIFRTDYINDIVMRSRLTIRHAILALAAFILLVNAADAAELVMFRRDGCPWCAKWDREIGPIYPKTEFNLRAPVRQVNLDRGRDPSIVHAPIHYTPTFALIEDGKEVGRIEGYPGEDFFWVRLENLLERSRRPVPRETPQDASPPDGASATVPGAAQ